MRPLFKTQFSLIPNQGRSPKEVADEVMASVTDWIEGHYAKSSRTPPLPEKVVEISRDRDHPYQEKDLRLTTGEFHRAVYWSHESNARGGFSWSSLCDLAHVGGRVDFQFVLGVEADDYSRIPQNLRPGRPRLLPKIIGNPHWRCMSGNTELPLFEKTLTIHDIEEFCSDNLFAEDRRLPVVVLSPRPSGKKWYPVKPRTLADRLCGVAKVVVVRDYLALKVLNQYLGSNLNLEPDTIRVFHPGLRSGDDPLFHWSFLGETIRSKRLTQVAFADFLFAKIADRGVIAVSDPPALAEFRRVARIRRDEQIARIERDNANRAKDAEELFFEAEGRASELKLAVKSLEEQLSEKDDQIRALRHQLDTAQENIAALSRAAGAGIVEHAQSANRVEGETVEEIVRAAVVACPHLEILDSAIESSTQVPVTFQFPDRVRAHLEALENAGQVLAKNGKLGTGAKEYFKQPELVPYKAKISEKTRGKWGDEYKFLYLGKKELFEEHFTIGVRSANTCLSIHFSTRLAEGKVVVAYVGRHLTNTQS